MNVKSILASSALLLMGSMFSVSATADELCGQGPSVELVGSNNAHIKVRPVSHPYWDHKNLQWAVDNVQSGGLVELCEGNFYLGDNIFDWKTVHIKKGLTVKGKKVGGELKSVVVGGGSVWAPGSTVFGIAPDPHAGPFIVNSRDENSVNFDQVWLREWISEAVIVAAANGFSFTNSKITHPKTGGWGYPVGGTHFVHAILIFNKESTGTLTVTDNDVDLTWYTGKKFHDVQFVALFGSPVTTFTDINLSRNTIVTPDEAFELTANTSTEPSRITVAENTITAHIDVEGDWPYHYPIFVAGNKNVEYVRVENNTINISNDPRMSKDTQMGAFVLTGDKLSVTNNTVHFNNFDGKIFDIGNLGNIVVVDFGASMTNSVFADNVFTGTAKGQGIHFNGGCRNKSQNNTFYLGDMINHVSHANMIDSDKSPSCGNEFFGETGNILGSPTQACK